MITGLLLLFFLFEDSAEFHNTFLLQHISQILFDFHIGYRCNSETCDIGTNQVSIIQRRSHFRVQLALKTGVWD
jgi:hypothetical protein